MSKNNTQTNKETKKQYSVREYHNRTLFFVCLFVVLMIFLTCAFGTVASNALFLNTGNPEKTTIKHGVTLTSKFQNQEQLYESFSDRFNLTSRTFPVSKTTMNLHQTGERGTLVYRNGQIVSFQNNNISRQDRQNLKHQLHTLISEHFKP